MNSFRPVRLLFRIVIPLLGLLVAGWWYDYNPDLPDLDWNAGPEAAVWLGEHKGAVLPEGTRYSDARAVEVLVCDLYAAGAERVLIPRDAIYEEDGQSRLDVIAVILPTDSEKRQRVVARCDQEMLSAGCSHEELQSQNTYYLCWE